MARLAVKASATRRARRVALARGPVYSRARRPQGDFHARYHVGRGEGARPARRASHPGEPPRDGARLPAERAAADPRAGQPDGADSRARGDLPSPRRAEGRRLQGRAGGVTMSADELVYAGIRELGGLFRRCELSPVDYAT